MKLFFTILIFLPLIGMTQNKKIESTSPEYIGGSDAMSKFIIDNFNYPEKDYRRGKQGTIWVEFIVSQTGELKDITVVKGVSRRLNKESIRVVSIMSNWNPGTQNGVKVSVRYTIPIKAKLGDAYQKAKKVKFK